jgi:ribosomal protein S18 acetylase RimI-like enzyme
VTATVVTDATTEDAGEILTVQRAAYLSEGALHDSFTLPPLTETVDQVRAAIAGGGVLKAVLGTRIVGAVRAALDGDTCHVGRLAVAPDLQGQGIGTRLLAAVEQRYAGRVARFELFTGPNSAANLRLYRRLGYVDIAPPPGAAPLVYLEKRMDHPGARR